MYQRLLDEGFRVITMDLRGHGLSDKPHYPDAYGLKMVKDVVNELDKDLAKMLPGELALSLRAVPLEKAGVKVQEMPSDKKASPLEGKTFVFTGKLESRTREEVQRLVEDLGGRATSSVSGETDYVVEGENPGSNLEEAKKKNVRVLDEKAFEKLINEQ